MFCFHRKLQKLVTEMKKIKNNIRENMNFPIM